MPINVPELIQQRLEEAFPQTLQQVIREEAARILKEAFAEGGALRLRVREELQKGFDAMLEGIQWEARGPGFRP